MDDGHKRADNFSLLVDADKRTVDTPSLMVDLDSLEANIARIAGTCRQNGHPDRQSDRRPAEIARLVALRPACDVIVAVDDPENVAAIGAAARAENVTIRLVIEVNMGTHRAGVEPGDACVKLARFIAEQKGVRFAGLMGWEGRTAGIGDPRRKADAVRVAVASIAQTAKRPTS